MELRTPIVVALLSAAAGAALARAVAPTSSPSVLTVATASEAPSRERLFADPRASGNVRSDVASRVPRTLRGAGSANSEHTFGSVVVDVAGEVAHPGVYTLAPTARAVDAVHAAGGPTHAADLVAVNLAAPLEDGTEVVVPARDARGSAQQADTPGGPAAAAARPHGRTRRHRRRKPARPSSPAAATAAAGDGTANAAMSADAPGTASDLTADAGKPDGAGVSSAPVDLNAADEATLATLPGVGPALAARIVAFRTVNGPFASTDELLDVNGMTPARVDRLAPYVRLR